jgi:hypothetical protein
VASPRHLPSSALLVVLAGLLAAIPGLLLFQGLVQRAREGQQLVMADLVVRLNDRVPHHLTLRLGEVPGGPAAHVRLSGQDRLRGGSFPWREAPLAASLTLDLPLRALAEERPPFRLSTPDGRLSARYAERVLGGPEETEVACAGRVEVERLQLDRAGPDFAWVHVRRLDGTVELLCDASGADGRPGSDDDLHFALVGTLAYHRGRSEPLIPPAS